MNIAIGYVRRSAKSDASTVSIEEQRRAILEFCKGAGMVCAAVIVHDGISGTKRKRFADIEAALAVHGASHLLVYHRDRLARDVAGLLDTLRDLPSRGVTVQEVATGSILAVKKSQDFLTVAVAGMFDEYFPRLVSEKTVSALRCLREQKKQYTRVPPLGWRYVEGRMVADEDEQKALVLISKCRSAGLGRHKTQKILRASGYSGRGGLSTIQRLLEGGDI